MNKAVIPPGPRPPRLNLRSIKGSDNYDIKKEIVKTVGKRFENYITTLPTNNIKDVKLEITDSVHYAHGMHETKTPTFRIAVFGESTGNVVIGGFSDEEFWVTIEARDYEKLVSTRAIKKMKRALVLWGFMVTNSRDTWSVPFNVILNKIARREKNTKVISSLI